MNQQLAALTTHNNELVKSNNMLKSTQETCINDIHKHEHTYANSLREIEAQKQRARAAEDSLAHTQIQLQRLQAEQQRNTNALQNATKRHSDDENAVSVLEKRVCELTRELDGVRTAFAALQEHEGTLNQRIRRGEERDKHHLQVCVCVFCICVCACVFWYT
jgi:DNA repair exonuclease SbcCD ATPase subunit